jgi:tetratricopeptide (TPR) repeat protein
MKISYLIVSLSVISVLIGCSSKEPTLTSKQPIMTEVKSTTQSLEELNNACLAGEGETCLIIADQLYKKGDYENAKIFNIKASKLGVDRGYIGVLQIECDIENKGKSCNLLAFSLEEGRQGIPKNLSLAFDYYSKAFSLGYTDSASLLAGLYYNAGDYFNAIKLHKCGCENNSNYDVRMEGCYNTGLMYDKGKGVRQDYQQARKFYKKACDGNYAFACTNLGVLYAKGLGVRQDIYKAKELYGKGCDGGNQIGCDNYREVNN